MADAKIEKVFSEHPVFKGMSADYIKSIADCGREESFEPSSYLFFEGDPADSFFVLLEGQISLQISAGALGMQTITNVGPNEVLGWSWIVDPYTWHFSARSMAHCRAIRIDARCLRGKFANDPTFGFDLMQRFVKIISHRLTATRIQLIDYMA